MGVSDVADMTILLSNRVDYYLIDAIGIERDVSSDLVYGRKRLLVRPHALMDFFPPAGML